MEEIFNIASIIAKEHNISLEDVLESLVDSIKMAVLRKYGEDRKVKTELDIENKILNVLIEKDVTESAKKDYEIDLKDALSINPDVKVGDKIYVKLDTKNLGRIAASTTKSVMSKMFRDIEKHSAYEEYSEYVGKIISGEIWSVGMHGDVLVDLKNAIGILPKREQAPNDKYIVGELIKAYVIEVLEEPKGVKLLLSRTHPGFVKELFKKEVPEVRDGNVDVKAVARDPSHRTKVAVYSNDSHIDPIGTCVGSKGVRISSIVKELGDEKIDVVKWSANPAVYIRNAIAPAKAVSVDIDEDNKKAKIYVEDEEYSMAIGKAGINAKLAAKLTGYSIDIIKNSEIDEQDDDYAGFAPKE